MLRIFKKLIQRERLLVETEKKFDVLITNSIDNAYDNSAPELIKVSRNEILNLFKRMNKLRTIFRKPKQ